MDESAFPLFHEVGHAVGAGVQACGNFVINTCGGWLDKLTQSIKDWDPQGGKNAFGAVFSAAKERLNAFTSPAATLEVAPPSVKLGRSAMHVPELNLARDSTSIGISAPQQELSMEQRMADAMTKFKYGAPSHTSYHNDNDRLGELAAPSFSGVSFAKAQSQSQGLG